MEVAGADSRFEAPLSPSMAVPVYELRSHDVFCDDAALARLRSFDIFYRHRQEELKRDSERRWSEQERVRRWRAKQVRSRLFLPRRVKDDGIIEDIVVKRNNERRSITPEERRLGRGMIGRPRLPRGEGAVSVDPRDRTFYWGA
jgi:hypothetical protein